jgi:hypothetical protein
MIPGAIKLDSENRSLEALLDAAGTDVIFTVGFRDEIGGGVIPRGSTKITPSSGTGAVTICSAPSKEGITREIDFISAYNGNAATRVVTIQIDDNATDRIHAVISLATTESAVWTPASGWQIVT